MKIATTNEGHRTRYTVDAPITEDEAAAIQTADGYHPDGYDLCGFKVLDDGTSTWIRFNCCD